MTKDRPKQPNQSGIRTALILLTLVCLSLLAIQPFTLGEMPETADGTLHLYRLIAVDHSLANDGLWARFNTGLAYGYGAPIFNFFSPFAFYLPQLLHWLGASFVQAWLGGMALYIFLAGVGAYLWGRSWLGEPGGLVTAVAYIYTPYFLFDTLARGNISEVAALAALPFVLWAFTQLVNLPNRRYLLLAVLSYSVFTLMHNIIALHGTFLLGLYVVLLWLTHDAKWRRFLYLAIGIGFSLGITTFFWLPALAETDFVRINAITDNLPHIDVTNHLGQSISDILALPFTADPTQMQAPIPIGLSWLTLLLALIAVLWSIRHPNHRLRYIMWLSVFLSLLFSFMNLEIFASLWRIIPLIDYTQFPWRLLGIVSLLVALLAGAGVSAMMERIRHPRLRQLWLGGAIAFLVLYSIPWLYSLYLPNLQPNSIRDVQEFERASGQITLSSYSEYLPVWTAELPDTDATAPNRLQPNSNIIVVNDEWGATWGQLEVTTDEETTLVLNWLFVPGWGASLNGEAIPVTPTDPEGLVSVEIPPGISKLEISLGMTQVQSLAVLISFLSLVMFIIILYFEKLLRPEVAPQPPHPIVDIRLYLLVSLVALALFLLKTLVIDHTQNPLRRERFADGIAVGVDIPIEANFNNEIVFIGADVPSSVSSDDTLPMQLYWRLNHQPPLQDYSSIIRLRDVAGNIIATTGSFMPGDRATSNWIPGTYIQERLQLEIPGGTPPGIYTLEAGLFVPETGHQISLMNASGNPEDVKIIFSQLSITRPNRKVALRRSIDTPLNTKIRLLDVQPLPEIATVGEALQLEWDWELTEIIRSEYRALLVWLNENNEVVAESAPIPLTTGYPTTEWQVGDEWHGIHRLFVPGTLHEGNYRVAIEMANMRFDPLVLQAMEIETPPRIYDLPAPEFPMDVNWINGIRMIGYDINANQLYLYWQTEAQLNESLHLFVHLLDREQIIDQSDGVPADWTRPTTGWDIGEFIRTTHHFDFSEDRYTLRLGWYDPITGNRVTLPDGNDHLLLDVMNNSNTRGEE